MAYYSNHFDRACHLLMHPELWDIPGIMLDLQTTILPDEEFLRLPAEHIYAFFNYNDETRALFYQISENKRAHVLVTLTLVCLIDFSMLINISEKASAGFNACLFDPFCRNTCVNTILLRIPHQ